MRKFIVLAAVFLGFSICSGQRSEIQSPQKEFEKHLQRVQETQQREEVQKHISWIAGILNEAESIKPGMTRRQLLQVFTIEGGLSTRTRATYAHLECPMIKVDVEFNPIGRETPMYGSDRMGPRGDDKIRSISKPYLARAVAY